jgi:periplasmic divalent cation tolerance protein
MVEFNQVVILVTAGNREEAEVIADVLLEQNRAACVNIVPAVNSHFLWQGKLEAGQEVLLIVKTQALLVDEVTNLVKTIHSYDVPEIIALPIIGGNPEYLAWIDNETESG